MSATPGALKVLHLSSHGINVGDGALNSVIRDRLQAQSERPIDFTLADVFIRPRGVTAADVDAFDLVVVGGGGGISNGTRNARNGTTLPMTLDEYRASRTPFAFTALGYNLFADVPYRYRHELAELLRVAAERGDAFSVRNDGSRPRLATELAAVGVDAGPLVEEIPDPGFFVVAPARHPPEASAAPYVILQVAGDQARNRFPTRRDQLPIVSRVERRLPAALCRSQRSAVDALARFARSLSVDHGLDVLVAPHIPPDLRLAAAVVDRVYAGGGPVLTHRPVRMLGTPHPSRAGEYFGIYRGAAVVIAMRGHAAICGVGLGRPVVALSTHPKVAGFMQACDLERWTVEPSPTLDTDLRTAAESLLGEGRRHYRTRRDGAVATFSDRLDSFLGRARQRAAP